MSKQLSIFDSFSIEPTKNQQEIVGKTALQIAKDFALYGMKIELNNAIEWNYEELFNQLLPAVERFIRHDYPKFLAFLLRIDVTPASIRSAETDQPDKPESEIICGLIISREFKKVNYRMLYKSKYI